MCETGSCVPRETCSTWNQDYRCLEPSTSTESMVDAVNRHDISATFRYVAVLAVRRVERRAIKNSPLHLKRGSGASVRRNFFLTNRGFPL